MGMKRGRLRTGAGWTAGFCAALTVALTTAFLLANATGGKTETLWFLAYATVTAGVGALIAEVTWAVLTVRPTTTTEAARKAAELLCALAAVLLVTTVATALVADDIPSALALAGMTLIVMIAAIVAEALYWKTPAEKEQP